MKSLSLGELGELNKRVAREIEVRERAGKADVIKKLRKLAAAEGLALEELLSVPRQPQATASQGEADQEGGCTERAPLPIRYAHPGNPELKWSGRGRRPSRVELWAQNGGAMSALENAAERLDRMSQSVQPVGEAVPE